MYQQNNIRYKYGNKKSCILRSSGKEEKPVTALRCQLDINGTFINIIIKRSDVIFYDLRSLMWLYTRKKCTLSLTNVRKGQEDQHE